jgi:hypothetical protein
MSLYKNIFRFILEDAPIPKIAPKKSNLLYRTYFEDILGESTYLLEDMPPAGEFGYEKVPFTSPTEYVKIGQLGNKKAR